MTDLLTPIRSEHRCPSCSGHRIDSTATPVAPATPCQEWTGALAKSGYGRVKVSGQGKWAHRAAWERDRGPIPTDLEIDHLCRNRRCVNPAHMELVTHRENIRRGNSPFAIKARKTHCIRGHALDAENTYVRHRTDGVRRECRKCHRYRHSRPPRSPFAALRSLLWYRGDLAGELA